MTRYMLSVHSVQGEAREPMSPEDMQHSWQQIGRPTGPLFTCPGKINRRQPRGLTAPDT